MDQARRFSDIKPSDLPAPPQEAIRIVHACSDPKIDSRQLGAIIANDPVLTAELLRIANSPFFGFRARVRSAAHAVTLLGHRALRNLALCVAMRDALRPQAIPGLDLARYWEAALRRAVCAGRLAEVSGLDADECFTGGLLQDFGLLALLYLYQERVPEWGRLESATPDERLEMERNLFGITHDRAGLIMAREWELPEELVQAIGHHHSPVLAEMPDESIRLCRVMRTADWMAAVFSAADKRIVYARCQTLLQECFGLDGEAVEALLGGVASGMEEAAEALGFKVQEQPRLEDVLREANLRLAEDNLSFQELTWKLEQSLAERDRLAQELNRELSLAREVQCGLLPRSRDAAPGVIGINVSARQVSGDFFDYFPTRDGLTYFAIADVSGKGMHAALLMAKTSSLFHCLGKGVTDPGALCAMLNREISEKKIRGMFVTMAVGVFNPLTGKGKIANAGHLPVLQFLTNGEFREYPAGGPPLGVLPDSQYPVEEFNLRQGALYLFTDGLTEARRPGGGELGLPGLKQLIRKYHETDMERRLHRIVDEVRQGQMETHDDLTLLLVERTEGDA
ncbi:MAG TPA: HDOD domain-containing protein [Thiotrichales bacterium]|nr:HDOD domain-containing protein [Thiotrichales bacterium]